MYQDAAEDGAVVGEAHRAIRTPRAAPRDGLTLSANGKEDEQTEYEAGQGTNLLADVGVSNTQFGAERPPHGSESDNNRGSDKGFHYAPRTFPPHPQLDLALRRAPCKQATSVRASCVHCKPRGANALSGGDARGP